MLVGNSLSERGLGEILFEEKKHANDLRTGKMKDADMVRRIKKMIEEDVKCSLKK